MDEAGLSNIFLLVYPVCVFVCEVRVRFSLE